MSFNAQGKFNQNVQWKQSNGNKNTVSNLSKHTHVHTNTHSFDAMFSEWKIVLVLFFNWWRIPKTHNKIASLANAWKLHANFNFVWSHVKLIFNRLQQITTQYWIIFNFNYLYGAFVKQANDTFHLSLCHCKVSFVLAKIETIEWLKWRAESNRKNKELNAFEGNHQISDHLVPSVPYWFSYGRMTHQYFHSPIDCH